MEYRLKVEFPTKEVLKYLPKKRGRWSKSKADLRVPPQMALRHLIGSQRALLPITVHLRIFARNKSKVASHKNIPIWTIILEPWKMPNKVEFQLHQIEDSLSSKAWTQSEALVPKSPISIQLFRPRSWIERRNRSQLLEDLKLGQVIWARLWKIKVIRTIT